MATVTAFIRTSVKNTEKAYIRFRLRDGRNVQLFHVSNIVVNPKLWSNKDQGINPRIVCPNKQRIETAQKVAERKQLILSVYDDVIDKDNLSTKWLDQEIDKVLHPHKYAKATLPFFDTFKEFTQVHKVSEIRKKAYFVVIRELERFELIKNIQAPFTLSLQNFDIEVLREFESFLTNETQFYQRIPKLYEMYPSIKPPQERGQNTISSQLAILRTFFNWAVKNHKLTSSPFTDFKIAEQIYGTPYYITIEERNKLYRTNLNRHPHLAVQRDIFVFQCLIGCRVGDLIQMTKNNVINNAIEYIPRKTKEGRPVTVRVPLNRTAKEIILRYADNEGDKLLPFISAQKYNDAIKVIFRAARLNRMVTVLNPTTRKEEKQRLSNVASSHIARRCFVGNLYKQVKDPNLVGALSGHKEGSSAFARYREIDDEIKTELINLLD